MKNEFYVHLDIVSIIRFPERNQKSILNLAIPIKFTLALFVGHGYIFINFISVGNTRKKIAQLWLLIMGHSFL